MLHQTVSCRHGHARLRAGVFGTVLLLASMLVFSVPARAVPVEADLPVCTAVAPRPPGTPLDDSYTSRVWVQALKSGCLDRGWVQQWQGTPGTGTQQDEYVPDQAIVSADKTTFDAATDVADPKNTTLTWAWDGGDVVVPGVDVTPLVGSADWYADSFYSYPDAIRYRYRNPSGTWGPWQEYFPPVRLQAQGACEGPGTLTQGAYQVDYSELGFPDCTYKVIINDPVDDPNHVWLMRDLEVAANIPYSGRSGGIRNVLPNGHLSGTPGLMAAGSPVLLFIKALPSQPPTAMFTATPGSDASTVDLDASISSAAPLRTVKSYDWTYYDSAFNEVGTATGVTTTKTFSTPGPWYAALKVTDSRGETTTSIKTLGDSLQASATTLDPAHPTLADSTVSATFTAENTGITTLTGIETSFGSGPDGVVGLPTDAIAPFSLAPGASKQVTAVLPVHGPGEGFAAVRFTGTGAYGPVDTGQTSLPFDVAGGALSSTLEVTALTREGTGGFATITAHVRNDTGTDLVGLQADLRATPSADVSILELSGPTTLAEGQAGDFVYDVQIGTTQVVDLLFDVQGRRTSDDALVAATPQTVSVSLSAPLIESVAADRSGEASGTAKGGERVVVTGQNLQEVTEAGFEVGGVRIPAEQLLVTSDTEIEFVTPKMVSDLQLDAHGDLQVDTNLILTGNTGLPVPADRADSNPYPFTFEGPIILSVDAPAANGPGGSASGDALGNEQITITGRNLTDVTDAVFRDDEGQQLPADITVTDDGNAVIETHDATSLLTATGSSPMSWSSKLSVLWNEALPAPYDEVASGPISFTFEGPVVTNVETDATGIAAGDVRGGEQVTVTGRNLGSVTDVTFSFTDGPALPAADVATSSDTQLTFTTPSAVSYLHTQPDGSTSVVASLTLSYETTNLSPHDVVTSGRTPFRFDGPLIDSRSTDTVDAKGTYVEVQGRNLGAVTKVAYSVEGALLETRVDNVDADKVGFTTPDMTNYLRTLPDGTQTVSGQLYVFYSDDRAPGGEVTSNRVDITFTATVKTTVTQLAPAGTTEVQVASNEGWSPGSYGRLGPDGPVRQVSALGSLIFAAPTPIDLPIGLVITRVPAPGGDTTAPAISIAPASGTFGVGERVRVDYSCTDAGVGVESCRSAADSGALLDTSTPGPREVTVRAWDRNGNAASRTVTYTVSDTAPEPVSASAAFVKAAYEDFLGRAPSSTELADDSVALDAGTLTRQGLVDRLADSPEWESEIVNGLYQDTLGRAGDPGGVAYWTAKLSRGSLTVAQVAGRFYASPEYFNGIGGGVNSSWITDLYGKLLHRSPEPAGLDYWTAAVQRHGRTPVAVAMYQSNESRLDRVAALYQSLLGRAPDTAGAEYWAERILTEGDIALAADLAASNEYYTRARIRFP